MAAEQDDRTRWAEDRTIMANERTFAGWLRTGLAAVGLGVGFNALFRATDPTWVAKAIATIFILTGIFIFWGAQHEATNVLKRLNSHCADPTSPRRMQVMSALFSVAAALLVVAIWIMNGYSGGA
ncbi:DUF202 domain-containing protein [Parvularcula sp. LCG005]|uniref:YidH family protein n=1 Tax=Parvularcula sp. LCG005 TaxID=3078805 RepID=UPI002942F1E9|nr:DUF202 domain-containing protein [Parvularcula sp. LCG005]WOI53888.1 DUF202 domain-containing protein [Parvularcula sp. LCG005]